MAPAQVTYLEAHGTGTALGDPIEVEALSEVLGSATAETDALSPINPAALASMVRGGLYLQTEQESRSINAAGQSASTRAYRFPLFVATLPLGSRTVIGLSFSTMLDRTWGTELRFDGEPVQPRTEGDRVVFTPGPIADGPHEVVLRTHRRFLGSAQKTFRFVVDTAAPRLTVDAPAVVGRGAPLRLAGRLEPGAVLLAGTKRVPIAPDGTFELRLEAPPRSIALAAVDPAGNRSRWRVPVTVVPRRPEAPIRAVHVTAYAWADETLRMGVMDLVRSKKINAVELDLTAEAGEVGWASGVPLARPMEN